ncbi:MAG: DMT family transporter [Bdellovibrionales bacterium]|nr:DMT family transporter [Oligoflexia bacterium]
MSAHEKNLGIGITAGISTGIFWGIPFLVPQLLPQFSSLEIAFGRFAFFGIISIFFIQKVLRIVKSLSLKDRLLLLLLSASGFWFYSMLLFWGVHQTDGIIASLIIGLLPISIPLFSPGRKSGGWKFYLGLLTLLIGLLNLLAYPLLASTKIVKATSSAGVCALLICLALWTWFAVSNSRFLRRNPHINRKDFASVIGVVSFVSILPVFLWQVEISELIHREGFRLYLICSMALGFGASWLANWLWNICSFHCPSEIAGPLIVSETIFGLLYSFIFENRYPHVYEIVSILLFLLGVALAVTAQMKEHQKKETD